MDSLAEHERRKYEKVWGSPRYRQHSPGEKLVDSFKQHMRWERGQTLIDFGAGTGRATALLRDAGLQVLAVDCAENSLETHVPFVQLCLWESRALRADFGYCTDVLEHIPQEKVKDTVNQIRRSVKVGAFFQVALVDDGFGPALVGEPLHLTVEPSGFWLAHFKRLWNDVKVVDSTKTHFVAACHNDI